MTIIKNFEVEQEKTVSWKSKKITYFLGIFLVVLVLMEIWANNTLVSFGEKFEKISEIEQKLERENKILETIIAQELSLNNIASRSATLGLGKPKNIQYLP